MAESGLLAAIAYTQVVWHSPYSVVLQEGVSKTGIAAAQLADET